MQGKTVQVPLPDITLRDLGKTDPETMRRYVAKHEARLSNLSKREALKHF